jgi:hypothetical protein
MRQRVLLAGTLLAYIMALVSATAWLLADALEDTLYIPLDHPAIQYSKGPENDPVGRLDKQLESGKAKLDYAPNGWGYLPALLKQLGVNVDSQVLVFSRTSIQTNRISPRTPRAIYFNDDVTVGYVQNGEALELTGLDPRQGIYLYTLDPAKSDKPRLGRRDDCLRCHQGPITFGVPGLMVSSVHPQTEAREGHGSSFVTDQRIPLSERWGGWYVTGTHGSQRHIGNNVALVDPIHPGGPAGEETQNVTSLAGMFDTSKYLAPTSDIVALMTLEHQTRMTNLMTRIGWDARIAIHDGKWDPQINTKIDPEIDEMVTYMLFADEAPLTAPVTGVSSFTKTFPQGGPRDKQGRSLRDFDLKTRLFRYPLSYMIYSAAFDALPDMARERVYKRLFDVLTGKDQSKTFARLSAEDRRDVLGILRETKPNLPDYWQ